MHAIPMRSIGIAVDGDHVVCFYKWNLSSFFRNKLDISLYLFLVGRNENI